MGSLTYYAGNLFRTGSGGPRQPYVRLVKVGRLAAPIGEPQRGAARDA